jgi:hypothetical protein
MKNITPHTAGYPRVLARSLLLIAGLGIAAWEYRSLIGNLAALLRNHRFRR